MNLYHVAYAGEFLAKNSPVQDTLDEALELYGWYRVIEANDEFEAIKVANEECDDDLKFNEVYFVTPFIQQPTKKIEVIVTI